MDESESRSGTAGRNWLERLGQAFNSEPQSRDDLLEQIQTAARREIIPSGSVRLMEGVLGFHDMRARDVMIPRGQIDVIHSEASLEDILEEATDSGHSRYPVIEASRDEVVGILLVKELLRHFAGKTGSEFDLRVHLRTPMFVPESKRLDTLLADFRLTRTHMAIVLDEFGGVAGLVTIEDVLEEIVGDIDDEYDTEERINIRQQAPNRHTVKALTPIDEFNKHFGCDFPESEYGTIGGLVTHELGHLPRRGEIARMGRYEFKVLGADKRRLHLLLVTERAQPQEFVDEAQDAPG
ncbi:MAG: HlyC/CorC family transporter [Halothiobacillaceae bacterium]